MPTECEAYLIEKIHKNGAMDLGTFMSTALMHPRYGYYTRRDPFGASGDFVTAPEISQMFGEMIGAWVMHLWAERGKPAAFDLIECGAGRGTLMADILRVGAQDTRFIDAAHIHLIEGSAILREAQRAALCSEKVQWHGGLEGITGDKPCIILGNEFIDALPIEQLRHSKAGWEKRVLTVDKAHDRLAFAWEAADETLQTFLPLKTQMNEVYEVAPAREAFILECADLLKRTSGAALFLDYGHTKSHHGGTLQAVQNHAYVNVLHEVGQCDITAHVDFEALVRVVQAQGLTVETIMTQGAFLKMLGIEQRAAMLKEKTTEPADIDAALERLTGAKEMGDLFKVMCFHAF